MLQMKLLGQIAVSRGETAIALPSSRKTRALLAYLALSPGTHSRQALCELLWDIPDDPRAALRWSLSKLRALVNAHEDEVLTADRNSIAFESGRFRTDLGQIQTLASSASQQTADPADLEAAWRLAQSTLLEDCELPNQADFSIWLEGQRRQLTQHRAALAQAMAKHSALDPARRDRWAQRWLDDASFDPEAAAVAVQARRAAGEDRAADALQRKLADEFQVAGMAVPDFGSGVGKAPHAPGPAIETVTSVDVPEQEIQFVRTQDGVNIAWGSVGDLSNPPLVKAANWLTHMELDWRAPIWSPLYRELAQSFRFIRYDERGCGLSDWELDDLSFESFVTDLKQVADAAGLEKFPLLGISQGAAVSIEFAARYPDRVSHLILFGAYDAGWRHLAPAEEVREREAVMVLTETGWGRDNPAYRHMFSQTFMPDATADDLEWFDEFQRQTASPQNAVRFLEAFSRIDVRDRLANIACPTLVIHSRGDQRIPMETGRSIAAQIPGARFASIESNNHLLLGREPASAKFIQLTRDFLSE